MRVLEKGKSSNRISAGSIERGECFLYHDEIYMVSTSKGYPIYVRLITGGNSGVISEETLVVPVNCTVIWEYF